MSEQNNPIVVMYTAKAKPGKEHGCGVLTTIAGKSFTVTACCCSTGTSKRSMTVTMPGSCEMVRTELFVINFLHGGVDAGDAAGEEFICLPNSQRGSARSITETANCGLLLLGKRSAAGQRS